MSDQDDDKYWHSALLGCGTAHLPWLRDHGSLTKRIQQRCDKFEVRHVDTGLARVARDESALLGIAPQQLAYTREVFLYADGLPVVFAHSVLANRHLCGAWVALRNIGNRPLGAMLFAHPLVERKQLHYKVLRNIHPLYRNACATLSAPPDRLWARRSLFYLHEVPLLVTEVFLPEILHLTSR